MLVALFIFRSKYKISKRFHEQLREHVGSAEAPGLRAAAKSELVWHVVLPLHFWVFIPVFLTISSYKKAELRLLANIVVTTAGGRRVRLYTMFDKTLQIKQNMFFSPLHLDVPRYLNYTSP